MKKHPKLPALSPASYWRGVYRDIGFKIVSWHHEKSEYFSRLYPSGCWNYYVYIPEKRSPVFPTLWLPEEVHEDGLLKGRVTHDYYSSPVADVEMHGGITYYDKSGYVEGHRVVEIGCDYQHSFDEGHRYDENLVLADVCHTIDDLYKRGLVVEEKKGGAS